MHVCGDLLKLLRDIATAAVGFACCRRCWWQQVLGAFLAVGAAVVAVWPGCDVGIAVHSTPKKVKVLN